MRTPRKHLIGSVSNLEDYREIVLPRDGSSSPGSRVSKARYREKHWDQRKAGVNGSARKSDASIRTCRPGNRSNK